MYGNTPAGTGWGGAVQQAFVDDQMRISGTGSNTAADRQDPSSTTMDKRQVVPGSQRAAGPWANGHVADGSNGTAPAWLQGQGSKGKPDPSAALRHRMNGLRSELMPELAMSMGTPGGRTSTDAMSVEAAVQVLRRCAPGDPIPERIMRAVHHLDSRAVALLLKDLSKVGATAQAFTLFDWLRGLPAHNRLGILCDVYTYTACISLCMSHKGLDRALALLEDMKARGIERNVHTYTALMNVCIKTGNLPTALDMFQQMRQAGCTPNVVTYNTLIDVYGKLGQWDRAAQVLSIMRSQGVEPALRTYNTLIIACNMCQQPREALAVYQQLLASNVAPNSTTYNALISAYGKLGQLDKVLEVFKQMCWRGLERSVITYSSLISACEKAGRCETALQLFEDMQRDGCTPNTVTYNSLITACGQGNQWQRAEQLFKDMQVAGCTPDVVTYTALISALERSGRWLRAYQVFQDMTARGCKPDSIVHNAIIDALWQTGCVWAQAKAHALFMQAVSQGHFRGATSNNCSNGREAAHGPPVSGVAAAATRGRFGGGGGGAPLAGGARWQLNLHALTAGVAMVSLYQWLQDLRTAIQADGGASLPPTVSIVTDAGSSSREQGNFVVREAVSSLMGFWDAPFQALSERSQTGQLEAKSPELVAWVGSSRFDALLVSLFPPSALVEAAPSDPEWQGREEESHGRAQEQCTKVIPPQGAHSMALQRLPSHYLQQRTQLVSLLLEQGLQLGVPCDVVQDAVHLMDCAAEGAKATGSWPEQQLPAVAAALLRTASQAAGTAVPSMAAAAEKVHVDMGQLLEVEHRLASQLGDADATSSAGVMRCLQVFVDTLGSGLLRPPGAFVQSALPMMLSADALYEMPLVNCRPGVVAAALLYAERRLRGCVPFWPSTLARLTGVQDLSQTEASCALRAVQKLPRKNFMAALYKEQATLLVGDAASGDAGMDAAASSPRAAVAAAAAAAGAGLFLCDGHKDMLVVTRTAVVAAAQAAKVVAAVPALLRMADKGVSDGVVGGSSPSAHAVAMQGRKMPLLPGGELPRDSPHLGLMRASTRDAPNGGLGGQGGLMPRGRENSTGRVMRNVTHSVMQPVQQPSVAGQHMLVAPAGHHHHHHHQQQQGLLQVSAAMLAASAGTVQVPQQVMVAVPTLGGNTYSQVQAVLLPDGQLAFPQHQQPQQQVCITSEALAAGGLHMMAPVSQQQVFTGVTLGQQQQGGGGGQQFVTMQYGRMTPSLPSWQLPIGGHEPATYAAVNHQQQGQLLHVDTAVQQGLTGQQAYGVVELQLGGYQQEEGQLVASLEGLNLGQATYAPALSLGVPANATWVAG